MSLANRDCVCVTPLHSTPTLTQTHTHKLTLCPKWESEWECLCFSMHCHHASANPPFKCQSSKMKRHYSLAFVSKLVTDLLFTTSPRSFSPFSCFLITNPLALGGCAWVNRAVGACHVFSSGERSSQRSGMRWFVVIDSYLETGLMELSKLYANRLFPHRRRCTLFAVLHTHYGTHTRNARLCFASGTSWELKYLVGF